MALPTDIHPFVQFAGGASGDLGEPITQSLRFSSTAYLEKTSYTCPTTFTLSCWVKNSEPQNYLALLSQNNAPSGGNGPVIWFSTGTLQYYVNSGSVVSASPAIHRDANAWYHVVVQQTATTYKSWVNGQQTTMGGTRAFNGSTSGNFHIKRNFNGWLTESSGYLAEYHFLEAQALSATDFGRYNADGIWVPIKTEFSTAQYGSKGFHLTFDSTQTNGVGHDSSGQGNHFTASGIYVTPKRDPGWQTYASSWATSYSGQPSAIFSGNSDSNFNSWDWYFMSPSTANIGGIFTEYGVVQGDVLKFDVYPRLGTVYLDMNSGAVTNTTSGNALQTFSITVPSGGLSSLTIRGDDSTYWGVGAMYVNNVMVTNGGGPNFDEMTDTPTSNYATLNPLVRTYNTLSQGSLTWDQSSANDQYFSVAGIRMDVPTYGEMEARDTSNGAYASWGICNEFKATNVYQGQDIGGQGIASDTNSVHVLRNGSKYIKGTSYADGSLPTWTAGDIVRWTFNPDNGEIRVAVNGGSFYTWHTLSSNDVDVEGYKYFCAAACNAMGSVNFGQRPFEYSIPTGFKSLQVNDFPTPTIEKGSDHFQVIKARGDNSSPSSIGASQIAVNSYTNPSGYLVAASDYNTYQAFDGGTADYFFVPNNTDGSAVPAIVFDEPMTGTTFRVHTSVNRGAFYINGTTKSGTYNGWTDISSEAGGSLKSLGFTASGSASDGFSALEIDGNIVVELNILAQCQAAFPSALYLIKGNGSSQVWYWIDPMNNSNNAHRTPLPTSMSPYVPYAGESLAYIWNCPDTFSATGITNGRRNVKAGFSMVQYTGDNTNPRSIPHGLGKKPGWIILWDPGANDTKCFITGLPGTGTNTENLILNTSEAASDQFSAGTLHTPTDNDNFIVGNSAGGSGVTGVNQNGIGYTAFIWAPIEGYSTMGYYTGHGNADGPFIYCGFKPRWVLIKSQDADPWSVYDTERDITNPCNQFLRLEDSGSETDYGGGANLDIYSNGFKIRGNNGSFNGGSTYQYVAFAEFPFGGGENLPPLTGR